jgi:hypothetical protein
VTRRSSGDEDAIGVEHRRVLDDPVVAAESSGHGDAMSAYTATVLHLARVKASPGMEAHGDVRPRLRERNRAAL